MSADEQHRATKRARSHRAKAEQLLAAAFTDETNPLPTDVQMAAGMTALLHLLLAIEDRLTYGYVSILDGTVSCQICRVILLEPNADGHYEWHAERGEYR